MKHILKTFIALALVAGTFSCASQSSKKVKLKTQYDSVSYMIGMSIGASFETLPGKDDVDLAIVAKGIDDVMNQGDTLFTMEEMQTYLRNFMMAEQQKEADKAKNEGIQFLEENKANEGVMVTKSGLQYKVIEEGTGAKPLTTDKVRVHYTGKLLDGTIFDTSVDKDPVVFGLTQVIPGWTEGLQLMPAGSKYELYIPSELAYGPRGSGQKIPPHSVLIFEVELIEIVAE